MKKIKFLKPHWKFSYFPGDVVEVEEDVAKQLVVGGFAKEGDGGEEVKTPATDGDSEVGKKMDPAKDPATDAKPPKK